MLGVGADLSFMDARDFAQVLSDALDRDGNANEQLEYLGTMRGRLGYTFGDWTPFVTGGLAFASTRWWTHRPHHRQRGRDARPVAPGLGGGRRRRLRARQALVGAAGVSLHQLGLTGFSFASPGALRLALRHPSPARRPRTIISAPRRRKEGQGRRRPRLRQLGDPRPDDLHLPGLSAVPVAL